MSEKEAVDYEAEVRTDMRRGAYLDPHGRQMKVKPWAENVDFIDVQGWVSDLTRSGLSGSTVRQAHRVFSLLLETAVGAGGSRPTLPLA